MNTSLIRGLMGSGELKDEFSSDTELQALFSVAMNLERLHRTMSSLRAGLIISQDSLDSVVPLGMNQGELTSQFDLDSLGYLGFCKQDILGFNALTRIQKTIEQVRGRLGEEIVLEDIPFDDSRTWFLLGEGDTEDIAGLGAKGMRDLLRRARPERFQDLVALTALYRPGPLRSGMVDEFVERMRNPKDRPGRHPIEKEILAETHGMLIFQEQAMTLAHRLAGFSMIEADYLRKALCKRKNGEIFELRGRFIEGAKESHIPTETALEIFDRIQHFIVYAFNKSHSVAYSLLSYRMAYLKANYRDMFCSA
jgi:DNA polymerase-3 subunit alpha